MILALSQNINDRQHIHLRVKAKIEPRAIKAPLASVALTHINNVMFYLSNLLVALIDNSVRTDFVQRNPLHGSTGSKIAKSIY